MKGKSSSRVKGMEVMERPSKSTEESRLSGAYIRSLVKHLSSSSSAKDQIQNLKSPNSTLEGQLDKAPPPPPPPPPPPAPKKQVRRRLHASRPYQERLLNMAEARREIVNALKVHRASMKQANYPPPPPPTTTTNPSLNPSTDIDQPNVMYPSLVWSHLAPAPLDHFNLSLPNYQPLGLNLNFQGFNNIDTPVCTSNINSDPPIKPLSPHASYSSSHSYSSPTCANVENEDMKMHVAMDEKEMEEIRSIGEKHDVEWNDMVNLVTSAWWSNFLEVDDSMEGNGFRAFDDYCSQDASLPRLDIGEIEWMNDEWLS